MAAKGATAKNNVINKIAMCFGSDYIGEFDKKVYIWANDGGERVQIALALTCPKNPIDVPDEAPASDAAGFDWSNDTVITTTPTPKQPVVIDQAEIDHVSDLMARLGL